MAEFIYMGNPHKHGEGPRMLPLVCPDTQNTFVFEKEGKAIDVGEGRLAGKLKGNDHFKLVEPKRALGRKPKVETEETPAS